MRIVNYGTGKVGLKSIFIALIVLNAFSHFSALLLFVKCALISLITGTVKIMMAMNLPRTLQELLPNIHSAQLSP